MSTSFVCRILGRLLTGLFLLSPGAAFAQETNAAWLTRSWQTEDGLPDNSVAGLAQTADGYLWIGTPSGLARFDGLHFENISLTNVVGLPNRGIIAMMSSQRGGLWLVMDRGAVIYLNGSSSCAFTKDLANLHMPSGMAEDANGGLWIAYRGGEVYRVKGDKVKSFTAQPGLSEGLDIRTLTTDNQGRVWFAKAGQVGIYSNGVFQTLCRLDSQPIRLAAARDGGMWICSGYRLFKCDENGKLQDFDGFHPGNSGTVVTVMIEDHEGAVWIGTSYSGLYRHDHSGFETIPTTHQGILSLLEDRTGNIWAGTFGGGLDRIRPRSITLEGVETGLPLASVQSICEDTNGVIWAVTQNGVLVRKTGKRWEVVPVNDQWPGDATCIASDPQGALWIGTRLHGLFCWRDGRFVTWSNAGQLQGKPIHTLLASKNGDLWIGQETPAILRLHAGRIQTFDVPPNSRTIRAMAEDAAGNIWAGTSKGVLLRVTGDKVEEVTPRPLQQLASIRCLYATPDGALWIGYAGWGLGYMKGGNYAEINASQGFYDDYISHIVADGRGWLWFGANRGIFKVRVQDLEDFLAGRASRVRSVHYGRGDGLPSLQGTFGDAPDVLRSRDGRLWIPMRTALVVVNAKKLEQNSEPPPALLTRILVDDRVVARYGGILPKNANPGDDTVDITSANGKLHIPPRHRRIEFEFAVLSFNAPENVQFRYRLKGFEDDWVAADTRPSASYQRLSSGDYTFEVMACNNDGEWSKTGAQLSLVVAPFFWQTWWFRLTVLAAFTFGVIAIVRYVSFRRLQKQLRVLEAQAALQKERARIAKDIHDDLGANLTQIAFLGELAHQDRGAPEQVAARIGKISTNARLAIKSLDEIVWAVNPRNDTLAHLIDYAGQFAVDYLRLAGIRCRLDFPEQIPLHELSTDLRHNLFLVIKEALHNVVKHAGATELWLRASVTDRALDICLEDNGRGFENAPDDALADGLRNMRQRMADIGGEIQLESRSGKGAKVSLHLPWPDG